MRVKKIIKRTVAGFFLSLITVIIAAVVLAFIFENNIKDYFVTELNKSLYAKISYHEFSLSFIRDFPFASIRLKGVHVVFENEFKKKDTLLNADNIFMKFNLCDFLKKNYTLKRIEISNANINLKVYKNRSDNFHIFKERKEEKTSIYFEIEKLYLKNTLISYTNSISAQDYSILCNKIIASWKSADKGQNLRLKGDIIIKNIISGGFNYIENLKVYTDVEFLVNSSVSLYRVKKGELRIDDLILKFNGSVRNKKDISFISVTIEGGENDLNEFLKVLPERFKNIRDNYKSEGKLAFLITIEGEYGKDKFPLITVKLSLEKGKVINSANHIALSDIYIHAKYRNNCSFLPDSGYLEIESFKSKMNNGYINGNLIIKGFIRPYVILNANIDADLDGFAGFTGYDTLQDLKGKLKTNLIFKGRLQSNNRFVTSDFLSGTLDGKAELRNMAFHLKDSKLDFHDFSGNFSFNNNDISFEDFKGKISGSDFMLKGNIKNIFPFLFIPGNGIKIAAEFTSEKLNLDEILTGRKGSGKNSYDIMLPDKVAFILSANIKKLKFRHFEASEIKGEIIYANKILSSENLSFASMKGQINAALTIDGSNQGKITTNCSANINGVNIQKLFYSFENFGQKGITDEHIRGTLFATVSYTSAFNTRLDIDPASVVVKSNIRIESGELADYKPLLSLSKFIKVEELKNVSFSTLNNIIEIKNKTVYIPEMEIRSSALNLQATGTHTFGNVIDYHLQLLFSDLLSRKVKKHDEFGIEQDDGLGKTVLFIHLTGTSDNPVFKYDSKNAVKNLINNLKKEKENLKKIFRKDSATIMEQRNTRLQEKGKFIIDWDEDKDHAPILDTGLQKKNQKNDNGQKVKVEWE